MPCEFPWYLYISELFSAWILHFLVFKIAFRTNVRSCNSVLKITHSSIKCECHDQQHDDVFLIFPYFQKGNLCPVSQRLQPARSHKQGGVQLVATFVYNASRHSCDFSQIGCLPTFCAPCEVVVEFVLILCHRKVRRLKTSQQITISEFFPWNGLWIFHELLWRRHSSGKKASRDEKNQVE